MPRGPPVKGKRIRPQQVLQNSIYFCVFAIIFLIIIKVYPGRVRNGPAFFYLTLSDISAVIVSRQLTILYECLTIGMGWES